MNVYTWLFIEKATRTHGRTRTPTQQCVINYMGREPRKEHVHGYAWMNHVAVHPKQKKQTRYNIVSHVYTNTNYKKRMRTLFPSGPSDLGCGHIPEAWSGLGPLDGLFWDWGRWEGGASQWALPSGPGVPVPLCTSPQPPDPGSSACSETTPTALKGYGASGLEELWKAPWAPCLQVTGSHLQLPSLGSPHLWWKHPPQSGVARIGMCPGHRDEEGRRNGIQASGVSSSTFHSNWQSRNRTFPKVLVPPITRARA